MVFGNHEMRAPSRFINEIPSEYLDKPVSSSFSKNSKSKQNSGEFDEYFKGEMSFNSMFKKEKKNSFFTGGSSYMDDGIKIVDVYDDIKQEVKEDVKVYNVYDNAKDEIIEKPARLKSDKMMAGDKVKHKAWGVGVVVSLTGEGNDQKATIAFEQKGLKTVMLSFAPIERI